jgi:hypothetical protein
LNNIKQTILDRIKEKSSVFEKISMYQYRIRCPLCGDSQKNLKDSHMYLKCSMNPAEPILYNCFLCNSSGKVNKYFLDKLSISIDDLPKMEYKIFNKISSKKLDIDILTGTPDLSSNQVQYIKERIGDGFTLEDYDRFKIVWDMNKIVPYINDIRIKNTMPSNRDSISFISDDKSTLIIRPFLPDGSWRKIKLFPTENKSFYTIKSTIDIFTQEKITVSIAEGIIDILSIYKNFSDSNNSIFLSILGSDYESGVNYIISNGFVGSNIILKIYFDNDINEKNIKYQLKKYKWLFNKIIIYKNTIFKDCGTTIDQINLIKYRL